MSAVNVLLIVIILASAGAQDQCKRIKVDTEAVAGSCCIFPKNPNRPEDVREFERLYLSPGPRPGPPPLGPPPDRRGPPPGRPRPPPRPLLQSSTPAAIESSSVDEIANSTVLSTVPVGTTSESSSVVSSSSVKPKEGNGASFVFPTEETSTIVQTENKIAIDVPPNGCRGGGARDPSGKCVTPF